MRNCPEFDSFKKRFWGRNRLAKGCSFCLGTIPQPSGYPFGSQLSITSQSARACLGHVHFPVSVHIWRRKGNLWLRITLGSYDGSTNGCRRASEALQVTQLRSLETGVRLLSCSVGSPNSPLYSQKRAGVRCAGLLSELWGRQRCDRCPSRASAGQNAGQRKHVAISYCGSNF